MFIYHDININTILYKEIMLTILSKLPVIKKYSIRFKGDSFKNNFTK